MPVFISYSHKDKDFVNKLATQLVKRNAYVWVDTWELNVGDSIVIKVQDAIQDSSALLVVLSKTSVQSEWCKKELSAGLMRELDEKKVIVLPLLLEDCTIPVFLREKMYADFRSNFEAGLESILSAIARVINSDQGRLTSGNWYIDWAFDWGYTGPLFEFRFTLVNISKDIPLTVLTEIHVRCNQVVTRRYEQYVRAGLDWFGRSAVSEPLFEFANQEDIRLLLTDQLPQKFSTTLQDKKGAGYEVLVTCRRLGEDNGKDSLVNISDSLKSIRDHMKRTSRKPTKEELIKIVAIIESR